VRTRTLLIILSVVFLFCLRCFLGIQINFSHRDYEQIYLMGLENALSGKWSYWGPDVVWSYTRLPGALQGLLAGIPLKLVKHPYSPIIFSNLISSAGLIALALYSKLRFPDLSLFFLLFLFMLCPFCLFNGVVLLNTAYLIFTGAILFIAVFELFLYRDKMLLRNSSLYFFIMGFSLLLTYQLHLTWVMFLPFILVLSYMEWRSAPHRFGKSLLFFAAGSLLSGLTLLPTIWEYGTVMMRNAGGNVAFDPSRLLAFIDLFARYLGMATFDILPSQDFVALAMDKSVFNFSLIWSVRIFTIFQFLGVCVSLFFVKKSIEFKRTLLLFALTLVMALSLYTLSNKHLSARTYILLYPIPMWITMFAYSYLVRFRIIKLILQCALVLLTVAALDIGISNFNDRYSFHAVENKIETAIKTRDPSEFALRRYTFMDTYD